MDVTLSLSPLLFLPPNPHILSSLITSSTLPTSRTLEALPLFPSQTQKSKPTKTQFSPIQPKPQIIPKNEMGISNNSNSSSEPHYKTKKLFLYSNYMLLGAASSCIFLTLSLRLIPSLCGFFFILLHLLTILGALAGCHAASHGGARWYGAHLAATVLTAIFQGSISVLIFTRSDDFLQKLKSYVREDDGVLILKLAGGLCAVIFCLEWVVLTVAFFLKYYSVVEGTGDVVTLGGKRTAKVGSSEEEMGYLPYPSAGFHV